MIDLLLMHIFDCTDQLMEISPELNLFELDLIDQQIIQGSIGAKRTHDIEIRGNGIIVLGPRRNWKNVRMRKLASNFQFVLVVFLF